MVSRTTQIVVVENTRPVIPLVPTLGLWPSNRDRRFAHLPIRLLSSNNKMLVEHRTDETA